MDNDSIILKHGTVLSDEYIILDHIGKGGMADIYAAEQKKLGRRVSVKVLSPTFLETLGGAFENSIERFRREASIAARIHHPNVIEVYDVGVEAIEIKGEKKELDYIVMAHLPSGTIRETMDEYGFDEEKDIKEWLMKYMYPMMNAVNIGHMHGIIHRDIKPENFLMRDDDPVLIDFGLAKNKNITSKTTSLEDMVGTVQYIAPEQSLDFKFAREAADVYSLTKIIYEVVEGKIRDQKTFLRQVELSNTETPFLKKLNRLIMDGTHEDLNKRISSVNELKRRLDDVLHSDFALYELSINDNSNAKLKEVGALKKYVLPAAGTLLIGGLAGMVYLDFDKKGSFDISVGRGSQVETNTGLEQVVFNLNTNEFRGGMKVIDSGSSLYRIPGGTISYPEEYGSFPGENMKIKPFYLSSSPVTNQQYVNFLNDISSEVSVNDARVYSGDKVLIKLSEIYAGYKPILFKDGKFNVKMADHSSCPVIGVSGYGAITYAKHYNVRLPSPEELVFVSNIGGNNKRFDYDIVTPVMDWPTNKYGIRGVDGLIPEWTTNYSETENKFSQVGTFADRHKKTISMKYISDPSKIYSGSIFRTALDFK